MIGWGMRDFYLFEVDVESVSETTIRDEFGWVDGYAPGCGKFEPPKIHTHRIIAKREAQARERSMHDYGPRLKGETATIVAVRQHHIDAFILEIGR